MRMTSSEPGDLEGYEVIVGVCGGIAAYKVCSVVSALVQRGAGVTVAMTQAAMRFVGPTTFQTLTARPVFTDLWTGVDAYDPQHIRLTSNADLFLIAPATANMIGKIACGICDDPVSTMVTSATGTVMLAPAMNDAMWAHPPVQANVGKLQQLGVTLIGPAQGWLACRSQGPGRMTEPAEIVEAVAQKLRSHPPRTAKGGCD